MMGKWAWGFWQCKEHYASQRELLDVAGWYRTHDIPLDGVIQDKATTDAAGHFVIVPPRLPPGRHELTLIAMQPDGKEVISKRSVSVTVPPRQAE